MSRKNKTGEFKVKSYIAHANLKYSYSKSVYERNDKKLIITCDIHGDFMQRPGDHVKGIGCNKCGRIATGKKKRCTMESFLKRAINFHGSKFDYSLVEYNGMHNAVKIICPIHGEFMQRPHCHLRQGCGKCGGTSRLTNAEFIDKAKRIHGNRYSYESVDYKSNSSKVKILCKEHGYFYQVANTHLAGSGCRICAGNNYMGNIDDFTHMANKEHSGKYDYSRFIYSGNKSKSVIICPIHGDFEQSPNQHLRGSGCPSCSGVDAKYAYIHSIIDFTGVVKFGISKNPARRIESQLRKANFDSELIGVWRFPSYEMCRNAENECKRLLNTCVLTKREMPDGYTETTHSYNVDKIIEIYEKNGGYRK